LQYLGFVGWLSWMAEMAPPRIRGRFFGRREQWLIAGQAAAALAAGLFVWGFSQMYPKLPTWTPYAIATRLGAGFMIAAVVPLFVMPTSVLKPLPPTPSSHHWASLWRPLVDRRFLRLLWFGCWFSFFNGFTQSAQNYYPMQILHLPLLLPLAMSTLMRLGQWSVSPWLGTWIDRIGNRPVMIVSQLFVATGLLFFAAATPEHWAWILGAWVFWIAYAGLNIGLPNLTLKLSPEGANLPYVAALNAVTGLCYAVSTIAGGALVDQYHLWKIPLSHGYYLPFFPSLFILGWIGRILGIFWLFFVIEPPPPDRNDHSKNNVCVL
jgi:MFS family permease